MSIFSGTSGNDVFIIPDPDGSSIDGGDGLDTIRIQSTAAGNPVVIDLSAQTATQGSSVDHLASIEGAYGDIGNDTVIGDSGRNWLVGGAGNDVFVGGLGDDVIIGLSEYGGIPFKYTGYFVDDYAIDTMDYSHAPSAEYVSLDGIAFGGEGVDTLIYINRVIGSPFDDKIMGSTIWAWGYQLYGGDGNDVIDVSSAFIQPGNGAPVGGVFPNILDGGAGDDILKGGTGTANILVGSPNTNILIGGAGADTMTGAAGANRFVFNALSELAGDHITNYQPFYDVLDFSGIAGATFIGTAGFSGVAGQINYSFQGGTTVFRADANGDGQADGSLTLDNGDFVLGETQPGSRKLANITPLLLLSAGALDNHLLPTNFGIYLEFSAPVRTGSGSIRLMKSDGTLVSEYFLDDSSLLIRDNRVFVAQGGRLTPNTGYYFLITPGAFEDPVGNKYAGVTSPLTLSFTTLPDPQISGLLDYTTSIANGAVGVAPGANFTFTFNEAIKPGPGKIFIYIVETSYAPFEIIDLSDTSQVTISGNVMTINPNIDLFANAHYIIKGGDNTLTSLDGFRSTSLEFFGGLNFQTGAASDVMPPLLLSVTPNNGATGVSPNRDIVLTFNEPVRASLFSGRDASGYTPVNIGIVRADGLLLKMMGPTDQAELIYAGNTLTIRSNIGLPSNTQLAVKVDAYAIQDLAGNFFGGGNYITASPTGGSTVTSFSTQASRPQAASDFNGDGKSDILWQNDNGQAALWLMNGFTQIGNDAVGGNPGPTWHIKGAGDFNGDGKADILWQNDNGQAALWLMNGFSQIGNDAVGGNPGPTWHIKGTGDFNGDGKSDILWQNDNGQAALWLMNGFSQIGNDAVGSNPGLTWHIKGTGDFNGDGKPDILWQNDNGQAALWLMNGFMQIGNDAAGSNPGPAWHVKGTGDFNDDGIWDILWQNDDGRAQMWTMNELAVTGSSLVGGNPSSAWHVKTSPDTNGDGKSDILWQNDNGQGALWLMNGFTRIGNDAVGGNPGPSWHIIAASS